jgi:hypothetical protein
LLSSLLGAALMLLLLLMLPARMCHPLLLTPLLLRGLPMPLLRLTTPRIRHPYQSPLLLLLMPLLLLRLLLMPPLMLLALLTLPPLTPTRRSAGGKWSIYEHC